MKLQFESLTHGYLFDHDGKQYTCVTQTHDDRRWGGGWQRNTSITCNDEEVGDDTIIELAEAQLDQFLLDRKKKAVGDTQ